MTSDTKRVGVLIVGSHGAVATTVVAGAALMRKGIAPRHGMMTESAACAKVALASVDDLVFGGWDLRTDSAYVAALEHGAVPAHLIEQVRGELEAIHAFPAVVSSRFLGS